MNKWLLSGTLSLAVLGSGCSAQPGSPSVPAAGALSQAHRDLSCSPNKNNCFYFLPSVLTNPGFGNSVDSTAYTSPVSDTDTPTLSQRIGTCYGYHWQYSSYVNPDYTVGPNGNSLLWAVTVTLKQTGKNPGPIPPHSTCVLVFTSSAGKGQLVIKTPASGG